MSLYIHIYIYKRIVCVLCVCLSLPISFRCCCSSWLILSFLLLFFLFFLSGGPVLKIHLTNPPYSKCKKGKPTKGIRRAKKKKKNTTTKQKHNHFLSVKEFTFSPHQMIFTHKKKKKDEIIIIVGFLKEINRKTSPSHRAFAQQQQQHPFYSFENFSLSFPITMDTAHMKMFFFSCWPATAWPISL